jgi:uncharacterized protein (TIGR03067 family)
MTRRTLISAGVTTLSVLAMLLAVDATADESSLSAGLKALQGTWVTDDTDPIDARWQFKGENLEVVVNGIEYVGIVKLDEAAKPFGTMDISISEGPEDAKGKTGKGIYKLEGEKLIISVSVPGSDRPKDFEPIPDEVYIFELKKQ